MNKEFTRNLTHRLIIKVLLPTILTMFFLWLMIEGSKEETTSEIYNFNPEEIGNVAVVGVEEFKASINTKSDSIFLFCSNEDKKCYQLLKDLKELNTEVEYVNVLELVDVEKDELKQYEMFTNDLYPKLIIIKNRNITYYDKFLNKDELNKIL